MDYPRRPSRNHLHAAHAATEFLSVVGPAHREPIADATWNTVIGILARCSASWAPHTPVALATTNDPIRGAIVTEPQVPAR
jgi:hypothetical protein